MIRRILVIWAAYTIGHRVGWGKVGANRVGWDQPTQPRNWFDNRSGS
jgi:hypothetical protein